MVIFGPSATNRRNSITMLHIKDLIWTLYFIGAAVALEVTIVPDQGEISLGESKFFLCQVSGEATDISWYSPTGEKLLNQQQISVVKNDEYTSTLTIYNVSSQDAGIYKCVASSETEGESEGTVNLKIYQKLTFKYAPTPQEFTEGEDAVIICDVSSSIPSIITWRHKGKDVIFKKDVRFVVLANNYLQIRGIKKTDEGNYRCEGRILARGEINYKDIQVIVNVPPLIQARQIRVNATANMDESVVLSCDADGFPDPEISWLKKGEPIEDGEEKISFNEDKSEMTIYRVEKEDEAEYSCIANNQAGEAEAIVLLKVYAKPKITYVENKTAVELDEITLTCEASGDPIPSITWRTAHRNISSEEKASWTRPLKQETLDGHIVVKDHIRMSALTLKDIQYTDAGEYFCVASNPIGVDMQAMYFEVQYAPKIRGPVVVYTWEGNPVNITCDVLAHPSAAVSWFRDGQLLPSSNFSNIKIYNGPTFSSLEVNPDSENDFGNYNCSAVNSIGHESSEFILVQADTPSSPAIRKVEPYSSTVMIVFDEPDATGGVPILKYKAEWRVVGQEKWHARYYDAKEVSAESIITVTGLKPETSYMVKLSAVNGKGLGDSTPSQDFTTQPVKGEPSAPKLVGHLSEDGNSIKVDIIKQDDGGSPIRHYLVNYRALNAVDWKPEMRVPSNSHHVTLKTLEWNVDYEVIVVAENQQGKSKQARLSFRTTAKPTATTATTSASTGLGTGAIVGILIVTFVLLLVVVDVTCFFLNKCGLLMCIAVNFCGKAGPGAKGKDIEEGKAAFSKDESKEPIVEVRTEEERTPNHDGSNQIEPNETTPLTEPEHPADTTATVEDMLPSVTTVTTNSDTITETFATAQNSPTSETTTLTSSTAPPPSTAPDSNTVQSVQATPSKAEVPTASSPPPTSSPKVAPLVDLSDTPTNNPSKAVANQAGALNPSVPASAAEPPKAIIKPVTTVPANTTSPPPTPEPKQVKQEQSGTKSPEKESAQPSTVKSPTEPTKDESASLSNTKPLQGEDFQIDGGTFKTPEIDLAKDVFAALGTATPAAVASGKASELVSSTADTTVPPDSAKTEKTQVEENSKPEETDVKSTPAEVKTVPNEATQTNVNESKA
ncbi:neural cell adhesion molecule 1-B isoform X2 [Xenopus laevis]|uniref:Neural cell adhesion molecule 1-B isoform X2 n=1 Tax=Xenopus laevis TaxID=8355 RepID=A0A8J0T850_XENLA|nr:neural cell adhesion molecule 1-B isoform X2 [Xenopus laevis]